MNALRLRRVEAVQLLRNAKSDEVDRHTFASDEHANSMRAIDDTRASCLATACAVNLRNPKVSRDGTSAHWLTRRGGSCNRRQ